MIAVTFAHRSESRDFLRLLGERHREVKVLHTGIGGRACAEAIGPFLDRQRFKLVISSGFAGGLDDSLDAGDLLLAENFSTPDLLVSAQELIIAHCGRLATAGRVIESLAERSDFAREQQAVAVDMETASIAEACAARRLPFLSLRAISDTPSAPFPAPPEVLFDLERQKTPYRRLAAYLIRHPSAIVRLMHFQKRLLRLRLHLATELSILIREFA